MPEKVTFQVVYSYDCNVLRCYPTDKPSQVRFYPLRERARMQRPDTLIKIARTAFKLDDFKFSYLHKGMGQDIRRKRA